MGGRRRSSKPGRTTSRSKAGNAPERTSRATSETTPDLSRRGVLAGLGALGAAALGCSGDETTSTHGSTSGATTGGLGGMGGAGGSSSSATGHGSTSTTGAGGGKSCSGDGGLTPSQLLAGIDTFIILCMENRSFDHYLGARKLVEGLPIDGLVGNESNPDANGVPIPTFHIANFTIANPAHDWDPVHQQWDFGLNDGFVTSHTGPYQQEVMGYYTRAQIPTTWAIADEFTVCDRWFCSVLGPTWPNRFYLHGATSKSTKGNTPNVSFTSIFDALDTAGVSNRNYYSDIPWCSGAYLKVSGLSGIDTFFTDAAAGTLPQFRIIDPQFFGGAANDDHPPHDAELGQAFIASVYAAVAQSPQWNRCLLVIIYDEHGGFYDHVSPPATYDDDPEFAQLGFRVPAMVVGPFVRRGCVVSTQLEHVSIIKTLSVRYGLPSLNGRVDVTKDISSVIDPAFLQNPQPPPLLPLAYVSRSAVERKLASPPTCESQAELGEMADKGLIPRHLDRRGEAPTIVRQVLEHGVRLGAVKLV